jgi:hypothetical protein
VSNDSDNISHTAILMASDFKSKIDPNNGGNGKSLDIVVSYADRTDSVTIVLVKDGVDGKDAATVVLSNPTMTFDKNSLNQKEETEVHVYLGATEINQSGNGEYLFRLSNKNNDNKIVVNGNKITITNPGSTCTKEVNLEIYEKDKPANVLLT